MANYLCKIVRYILFAHCLQINVYFIMMEMNCNDVLWYSLNPSISTIIIATLKNEMKHSLNTIGSGIKTCIMTASNFRLSRSAQPDARQAGYNNAKDIKPASKGSLFGKLMRHVYNSSLSFRFLG